MAIKTRIEKFNEVKDYEYKGNLSYGEGVGYLDISNPWMMCCIDYQGKAIIRGNTEDIVMGVRYYKQRIYFNQFVLANPKNALFNYFGELLIYRVVVYGPGMKRFIVQVLHPNKDFPELLKTKPEDISTFPENANKGYHFHSKKSKQILKATDESKKTRRSSKAGGKGVKTTTKQSDIGSGGSTY